MTDKDKIIIRSFKEGDRGPLRKLCADTAFMGEPVERFFPDRELFCDWASVYYTDYEPQSIFVAEYENPPGGEACLAARQAGQICGYVMGAKDESRYRKASAELSKACLNRAWGRVLFESCSRNLFFSLVKSFMSGEFKRPDFSRHYPAHLHINVAKPFRGSGIGSMLINRFEEYLRGNKIYGARLSTISPRANRFFQKQGFGILYRRRVTYFDSLTQEEIYLSMYGKILERG